MKMPKFFALGGAVMLLGIGLWAIAPKVGDPGGAWPFYWAQYGNNPHRHAVFPQHQVKPETWTFVVGQVGMASPASVVNGVAYVGTNGSDVAAIQNGHRLWQVKVPNQVMATPLVASGKVIVGVGNKLFQTPHIRGTGWSGVMALQALTGARIWSVKTTGEVMPTPAIYKGRVYAATGAGQIIVISLRSGRVLNTISLQGSYVSMSSPLVVGHRLYVGAASPYKLYAINLKTDRVAWSLPTSAQGGLDDCSPVWSDGHIAIQYTTFVNPSASTMAVTMLGVSTEGKPVWSTPLGSGQTTLDEMQTGQPTVVAGTIYVGSPVTQRIYAISSHSGQIRWSTAVGAAVRGNPAIVHGALLVGDSRGRIDVLSARTGAILRQVSITSPTRAPSSSGTPTPTGFGGAGPVIVGPTLYIVTMNGSVLARPLNQFLRNPAS